jgi:hypothetical protein
MEIEVTKAMEKLLLLVDSIAEKYDKVAQETGVHFNIFDILKLQTNEIKHSAFIAELLNPRGKHGCGELFLEFFLQEIGLPERANLKNANIQLEKVINNYRRIDIFISLPNANNIIVENKIYAGDQENQLNDYHEFNKEADIIYLTLWEDEPSEQSASGVNKQKIRTISYQKHIKNWLEQCLEKAVNKPFVRENIAQYLNIVKELTHQSIFNDMKNEILENLLSNAQLAKAFYNLNMNVSLFNWQKGIFEKIKSKLTFGDFNLEATDSGRGFFNFWRYREQDDFCLFVEANKEGSGLKVGVAHLNIHKPSQKADEFKNKLIGFQSGYQINSNEWICFKEIASWNNTSWENIVGEIDKISQEIQTVINEVIKVIEEFQQI